jgi:N-acetylmuramoyl-L-alanine amidase
VEELSQKAKDQRMEQSQVDLAIAGHAQGQGQQQPQGPDTQAIADKENMQMSQGQPVPPTEGADITHTQAHIDFTKTDMFRKLPKQVQQLFADHIQGELGAHMGGQSEMPQQVPQQMPQMGRF